MKSSIFILALITGVVLYADTNDEGRPVLRNGALGKYSGTALGRIILNGRRIEQIHRAWRPFGSGALRQILSASSRRQIIILNMSHMGDSLHMTI